MSISYSLPFFLWLGAIHSLAENVEIFGPGLKPAIIVMPARYFIVRLTGENITSESVNGINVEIKGDSSKRDCRLWTNILDRKDGSIIVRYKLYETCSNLKITVMYNSNHITGSPFITKGPVYADKCNCPANNLETWLDDYGCNELAKHAQMEVDLKRFESVDFDSIYLKAVEKFENSHSSSVCHYVVKSNKIYRRCFGQHVGFKMFVDSLLLSLTRKVVLPDLEFFHNLGDWPLIKSNDNFQIPIFSWCGSDDTNDLVLPTYDLTEASLENMGRISLDMLSVQGNIEKQWKDKENKCFWRGRDASHERLELISIARKNPDLFNASLTNFFFFKDKEDLYGPKAKHISFFKFFDYKYQLNLDGTVAAYRFPFLLAGDSVVIKQNSKYYEHFYKDIAPWVHYIPIKTDLSDLVEKLKTAMENEDDSIKIAQRGSEYARSNLLPHNIICYQAKFLHEWSKILKSTVQVREKMEMVEQSQESICDCHMKRNDEL